MWRTETLAKWSGGHGLDTVEPVGEANGALHAIVGAYTLASEGNRVGGVHLVKATLSTPRVESVAFVSLPAVLDSRVCHQVSGVALAACADGSLRGLSLPGLEQLWTWDAGSMLLSLSIVMETSEDALVALSDASGRISLVRATRTGCSLVNESKVHSAEAWTVDATNETAVFSGGDDGYLYATDTRTTENLWKKKAHGGVGITSIVCHEDCLLYTGGYDDCLKIWDTRTMKHPLMEKNLGGGVWRIKFHPLRPELLLVACMYDGFKVVQVTDNATLDVRTHYTGHESIAYGAAWLHSQTNPAGRDLCALTASFYDKSLQLWSVSNIS